MCVCITTSKYVYLSIEIFINEKSCIFKQFGLNWVAKKKVTLSIDTDIYDKYRSYCEDHAILLSKKIELFMKKELENDEG